MYFPKRGVSVHCMRADLVNGERVRHEEARGGCVATVHCCLH